MLQKFAIFPAKQLAISKQVTPLILSCVSRRTDADTCLAWEHADHNLRALTCLGPIRESYEEDAAHVLKADEGSINESLLNSAYRTHSLWNK